MVKLGESDVPLDKDSVVEPRERAFFPTFAEWASDGNIEEVFRSNIRGTGTPPNGTPLYTVPANHTLFITSAWVGGQEHGNASTHGTIELSLNLPSPSGIDDSVLAVPIDHTVGQHGGNQIISQSFPMPLRVAAGVSIRILGLGMNDAGVMGGFVGFLLPKKISIR